MDEFNEYKSWVNEIESRYASYAYKSVNVKFLDGTTFDEYYSKIFNSNDIFNKQRNKYRTPFQLERDRILYSSLFQRLADKTQLFTVETNGLTENRFTHTLKVTQIAKSISRGLRLNEDLVEAIALGHDIGHPPFAHIGEKALNEWLNEKLCAEGIIKSNLKQRPVQERQQIITEPEIPILKNIVPEYWDKFKEYFTFGNDDDENLFMHGRQGFSSWYQEPHRLLRRG